MPLYTLHMKQFNSGRVDTKLEKALHQQISALHAKTFACDPETVRVKFQLPCREDGSRDLVRCPLFTSSQIIFSLPLFSS